MNWVYMLACADGTLYTGWTNDLNKRLAAHNGGRGAKYTRGRLPVRLVYREACATKQHAMRREVQIKRLTRRQKLALIASNNREECTMFREMRRKNQVLPQAACEEILAQGTSGVLAVLGDEGYPYAVPLSYAWHQGRLYFHCAVTGHKLDAIQACNKASFCVVAQDQVTPAEYTTYFRSVIAFGRVRVVEDEAARRAALVLLGEKYAPKNSPEMLEAMLQKEMHITCVLEMEVEHLSGKEARELAVQRKQ